MSRYRKVCIKMWWDDKIRVLPIESRYLFLYLLTAPLSHSSGLYYLPLAVIREETGLSADSLDASIQDLERQDMIACDRAASLWWVKKMASYQTNARSHLYWRGIATHLEDVPASPLIDRFRAAYAAELEGAVKTEAKPTEAMAATKSNGITPLVTGPRCANWNRTPTPCSNRVPSAEIRYCPDCQASYRKVRAQPHAEA